MSTNCIERRQYTLSHVGIAASGRGQVAGRKESGGRDAERLERSDCIGDIFHLFERQCCGCVDSSHCPGTLAIRGGAECDAVAQFFNQCNNNIAI